MNRILVVGVPRSGTTWVAHILGQAPDAVFLDEPDNHLLFPSALRAKRRLPGAFHPALEPEEPAEDYELLWRRALAVPTDGKALFKYRPLERLRRSISLSLLRSATQAQKWAAFSRGAGLPLRLQAAEGLAVPERPQRSARNLIVKSVYAALCLDWICSRFPVRTVVVLRAPLNVLSSWAQIGWLGRPGDDMLDTLDESVQRRLVQKWGVRAPAAGASVFTRGAWLAAVLTCELAQTAGRNPSFLTVTHEDLCERPHERLRDLTQRCGLRWSPEVDGMLEEMNQPGQGYELRRVAQDLPEAWRSRLSPGQVGEALAGLEGFPLDGGLVRSDGSPGRGTG